MHPTVLGVASLKSTPKAPRFASKFDDVVTTMQETMNQAMRSGKGVLFRVNAGQLFDRYISTFERADRQYHNCNCCHSFLSRFGSLVWMDEDGTTHSALWNESLLPARHAYRSTVKSLREATERGTVTCQAFWDELMLGQRESGGFTHLAVSMLKASHGKIHTASQAAAEARENRRHLERALVDLPATFVVHATDMLRSGSLLRGDKLAPMGEFLTKTHSRVNGLRGGEARNRALWLAVTTAAAGWCTPKSSAFGALVDSIAAGDSTQAIKRKHDERMDPMKYQRPTAPASVGNVREAEKLIDRLGLAASLRRRFATAEELVKMWEPQPAAKAQEAGIFGHLIPTRRQAAEANLTASPVRMTFAKFRRDVMPRAMELEVFVPMRGQFCTFTAAADKSAPPLLAWDSEECRNPWAWYVYNDGSYAKQWGLEGGRRHRVEAISLMPSSWGGEEGRWAELGKRALLVIAGAHDTANRSLALFPECLRGELHSVRSTIEAHSRSSKLEPLDVGVQHAAGLLVGDGAEATLVVRTAAGVGSYIIDRWE